MLLIVAGPHGYVSPSWYAPGATPAPTWNFSVAHCYGVPQVLEAEENLRVLTRLVAHFEQHVDDPVWLDQEIGRRIARGTVGIRLPITRFICKVKMSQDKDEVSQRQVLEQLRGDGPYAQPALAARHGTGAWRRVTSTTSAGGGVGYAARRRTDPRIAAYVHAALGDARTVLNVGAGAGSYEPEDRYVVAVEPSAAMRAQRSTPAVIGVAEALPFDDGAFDAAMATVTIHQWRDAARGVAELRRVARRVVILTFDPAAIPAWWLGEYVPEMLAGEAARYPALEALGGEVTPVPIPLDCSDGFIEAFYGRPEALLDPEVRRSQSAWAFGDARTRARAARARTWRRARGTRATATCARSRPSTARCGSSWPLSVQVTVSVNGVEYTREVEPRLLLVHFLRDELGADRDALGLRHLELRHVRGADGRQAGEVVHGARGDGRALRDHDRRRARARRRARPRPAGLPREARAAVRVLHERDDAHRAGAAGPQPGPDRRGDPDRDLRADLPLHGLRDDRALDPLGGRAPGRTAAGVGARTSAGGCEPRRARLSSKACSSGPPMRRSASRWRPRPA